VLSIALVSEKDGAVLEVVHVMEHDTMEAVKLRLRARGCHKIAEGQLVRCADGARRSAAVRARVIACCGGAAAVPWITLASHQYAGEACAVWHARAHNATMFRSTVFN